jgi:predicted nucleic acid-binding protein
LAGGNRVGTKQEPVLVDTNIFVIDLRYRRDRHFERNQSFLDSVAQIGNGYTTIVNLLEICGILSFNLHQNQLIDLWTYFQDRYKITVLPEPDIQINFPLLEINRIFDILGKKCSFGDALIMAVAEKYLSFVSTLVTWDNDHFKDKFDGNVLTPNEYMTKQS